MRVAPEAAKVITVAAGVLHNLLAITVRVIELKLTKFDLKKLNHAIIRFNFVQKFTWETILDVSGYRLAVERKSPLEKSKKQKKQLDLKAEAWQRDGYPVIMRSFCLDTFSPKALNTKSQLQSL